MTKIISNDQLGHPIITMTKMISDDRCSRSKAKKKPPRKKYLKTTPKEKSQKIKVIVGDKVDKNIVQPQNIVLDQNCLSKSPVNGSILANADTPLDVTENYDITPMNDIIPTLNTPENCEHMSNQFIDPFSQTSDFYISVKSNDIYPLTIPEIEKLQKFLSQSELIRLIVHHTNLEINNITTSSSSDTYWNVPKVFDDLG
jgi:hypothetical protein